MWRRNPRGHGEGQDSYCVNPYALAKGILRHVVDSPRFQCIYKSPHQPERIDDLVAKGLGKVKLQSRSKP